MSIFLNFHRDGSMALFIDGDLQFDQRDEKIYHEGLALPAAHLASKRINTGAPIRALIVGGGDGLTARELLKSQQLANIDLVDYSPEVLGMAVKELATLNQMSLTNEKVKVYIEDAWQFAAERFKQKAQYDLIVVDLTVAKNEAGARFHSTDWYRLLEGLLAPQGILASNGLSPSQTPHAYWSIFNSMRAAGLASLPYRLTIPSFSKLGYGPDWGFMLAAREAIREEEFDGWLTGQQSAASTTVLTSAAIVKNLFAFPNGFESLQKESQPGQNSHIFLHYLVNGQPYSPVDRGSWNALTADLAAMNITPVESLGQLLPNDIRHVLAGKAAQLFPTGEEQLLNEVLTLMPAAQPARTRELISDFMRDPAAFLVPLDIKALVDSLLRRVAELPPLIAAELRALQQKLVDWSGDWETLLDLGRRVVTTLAVVVILANFIFPDSAYGKGGHVGGGHGYGRGGHNGWGRPGNFNRRGWGGYGWGGGWGSGWGGPYYYGSGNGYANGNYNNGMAPDGEGNQYPTRPYAHLQVQTYGAVPDQPWVPPVTSTSTIATIASAPDTGAATAKADVLTTAYRLGPDCDVLPNGSTVVPLTDDAYLLVGSQATALIEQQSGTSLISLYSDPSLTWHLSAELQHQSKGLKKAAQAKDVAGGADAPDEEYQLPPEVMQAPGSEADSADTSGADADATRERDETEARNLVVTAKLLDKADQALGPAPPKRPEVANPPVEGAFELFNSAWGDPMGKFVIMKKADSSLVYMDGHDWYSDAGTTKLDAPYPTKLKPIIASYLSTLIKDAGATKSSLLQDQKEAQDRLTRLNAHLTKLQTGGANAKTTDASKTGSGTDGGAATKPAATGGDDQTTGADLVQFGTKKVPRSEGIRRMEVLIDRAQKHLDGVQKDVQNLPAETNTERQLLTLFQS